MKTNVKTIAKVILVAITIFLTTTISSCSKDDDSPTPNPTPVVYEEENFLNEYLLTSGLQYRRDITDVNYRLIEYLEFSASQKGKITSVSFKVPATSTLNPVIITIVDLETGLTIKEISTSSSDYTAGTTKTVAVAPPIELPQYKRYKLGMISKSSYENRRLDGENIVYPIQAGNIKIWGFSETDINTSLNSNNRSHYYGDFSFTFQRTE